MGMAIATSPMTLQDYLNFEDGTDTHSDFQQVQKQNCIGIQ